MSAPTFASPAAALVAYQDWLLRQPLAPKARRAYLIWVSQYCAYLPTRPDRDDPLADIYARSVHPKLLATKIVPLLLEPHNTVLSVGHAASQR